jgi:RNA polymerase sigma factor FliA
VSTTAITEREVAHLWAQYAEDRAIATRERLIIHYAPLVKYVAGRVAVGCPPTSSTPTWSATASSG